MDGRSGQVDNNALEKFLDMIKKEAVAFSILAAVPPKHTDSMSFLYKTVTHLSLQTPLTWTH